MVPTGTAKRLRFRGPHILRGDAIALPSFSLVLLAQPGQGLLTPISGVKCLRGLVSQQVHLLR